MNQQPFHHPPHRWDQRQGVEIGWAETGWTGEGKDLRGGGMEGRLLRLGEQGRVETRGDRGGCRLGRQRLGEQGKVETWEGRDWGY